MMRPLLLAIALASVPLQAETITISIDAAKDRHAIKPEIYGLNFASTDELRELNVPLNRWGGNLTSRYNWQSNAANHGQDYFFESIEEGSAVAGEAADKFLSNTRSGGAQAMVVIPMIGWVAKLGSNREKLASFSVAKYGPQQQTDPFMPDAGNGIRANGQPVTGNDPRDANVAVDSRFQQAWVQHITARWSGVRYYLLDNEPSIWFGTHRDVHPEGPTMEEITGRMIDYAARIKAADPNAIVGGPEEYGWFGYFYSGFDQQQSALDGYTRFPDREAHGGAEYIPWVLDRIRREEQARSSRLLDALTVHFYPQSGEFSSDVSESMQPLRNRSTRSLWDPSYVDQSWIADKVKLIPRLREWAEAFRPGTPIGITEYNWGAESHINGATAQADVLGIFGREGLDFATRWTAPDRGTPVYNAFLMYRNYDGRRSAFGDISVNAVTPNPDVVSAFAAIRSSDQALTVMIINKSAPSTVNLRIASFTTASVAQRWQLMASNVIERLSDVPPSSTIELVAQSITLFVIPSGGQPRRRSVRR